MNASTSTQRRNEMNLLLIAAIVLLALQALSPLLGLKIEKVHIGWLGLAVWALSLLVSVTV